MKIKKEKKEIIKYERVMKDINTYVAFDDKVFENKKECEKYEKQKKFENNIKKLQIDSMIMDEIPYIFYYASNEQELEWILNQVSFNGGHYMNVFINNTIKHKSEYIPKVGDWIGMHYYDGGDSSSDYMIYTLEYIKIELDKDINKIKEILK